MFFFFETLERNGNAFVIPERKISIALVRVEKSKATVNRNVEMNNDAPLWSLGEKKLITGVYISHIHKAGQWYGAKYYKRCHEDLPGTLG